MGAFKLVQAGAHGGVFPPSAEGCHEADISGVAQRIDTLARQVASGWVYACVHSEAGCPARMRGGVSGGFKLQN